jgi:hypothetical protein
LKTQTGFWWNQFEFGINAIAKELLVVGEKKIFIHSVSFFMGSPQITTILNWKFFRRKSQGKQGLDPVILQPRS